MFNLIIFYLFFLLIERDNNFFLFIYSPYRGYIFIVHFAVWQYVAQSGPKICYYKCHNVITKQLGDGSLTLSKISNDIGVVKKHLLCPFKGKTAPASKSTPILWSSQSSFQWYLFILALALLRNGTAWIKNFRLTGLFIRQ